MEHQVALAFAQERAVASLAGLFGILALLLAAIGLYGVTAYTVAQRTNEIGIRMALGADRTNVVVYILRGAFIRVAIGLVLGLPLAVGAGRLISSQLYNVSFWDPLALTVAAGALAICGLAGIAAAYQAVSPETKIHFSPSPASTPAWFIPIYCLHAKIIPLFKKNSCALFARCLPRPGVLGYH